MGSTQPESYEPQFAKGKTDLLIQKLKGRKVRSICHPRQPLDLGSFRARIDPLLFLFIPRLTGQCKIPLIEHQLPSIFL